MELCAGADSCRANTLGRLAVAADEGVTHSTEKAESLVMRVGLITVSDRASRGVYADESGPEMEKLLNSMAESGWELCPTIVDTAVIYYIKISNVSVCLIYLYVCSWFLTILTRYKM